MNLDDLGRIGRAATPGPWRAAGTLVIGACRRCGKNPCRHGGSFGLVQALGQCVGDDLVPDTTYIAAASPDVVLALIAVARAAEALRLDAGPCGPTVGCGRGRDDDVDGLCDWCVLDQALTALEATA